MRYETRIYNYYGVLEIEKHKGKYYINLDNWQGHVEEEISKELFDLIKKELCDG